MLSRRAWLRSTLLLIGALAVFGPAAAWADSQSGPLGYDDLVARLGSAAPTGAGVIAGQIEAPDGEGRWAPNPANAHFTGITFIFESGNPTTFSTHANTVGRHFYGNQWSVAAGIDTVHAWEVNHWLQAGFLRLGTGMNPPLPTNAHVLNHSWIGDGVGFNNEILRRVDHAINAQDLIVCVGVGNGASGWGPSDSLLSHAFNTISVGRSDGNHHHGDTLGGIDVPGRMKPEIVAPDGATSWTTALISGVCAVLLETARTWPGLDNNPDAQRPEVIKAALLAGATHRPGWSNNPDTSGPNRGVTDRPLDPQFGVDQANVNTSHFILTGLQQRGEPTPPTGGSATSAGWDFDLLAMNSMRFHRFEIFTEKEEVSVVLTWNRAVDTTQFVGPEVGAAHFELELFQIVNGNLSTLRGNAGLGRFDAGNIASVSDVDNIQHLYIQGLQPGVYALEVRRLSDGLGGSAPYAVAWFMPPDFGTAVTPNALTMIFGTIISGGLQELQESNDQYFTTNSQFGFSATEPNITEVEFDFIAASTSPQTMIMTIEARLNNPGGVSEVRLQNFQSRGGRGAQFDLVHSYNIGLEETVETIPGLGSEYINPSNAQVRSRVRQSVVATFAATGFESYWDHLQIITVE